jgi:hypothetical protein
MGTASPSAWCERCGGRLPHDAYWKIACKSAAKQRAAARHRITYHDDYSEDEEPEPSKEAKAQHASRTPRPKMTPPTKARVNDRASRKPKWEGLEKEFQREFDRAFPPELKSESASIMKNGQWQEYTNDDWQEAHAEHDDYDYTPMSEEVEKAFRKRSEERVLLKYREAKLTKRERDVFSLTAKGFTQAEVGKKLRITQQAAGKALESATRKLQQLQNPQDPV